MPFLPQLGLTELFSPLLPLLWVPPWNLDVGPGGTTDSAQPLGHVAPFSSLPLLRWKSSISKLLQPHSAVLSLDSLWKKNQTPFHTLAVNTERHLPVCPRPQDLELVGESTGMLKPQTTAQSIFKTFSLIRISRKAIYYFYIDTIFILKLSVCPNVFSPNLKSRRNSVGSGCREPV